MPTLFLCACLMALGLGAISEAIDNAQENGARLSVADRAVLAGLVIIGMVCVAAAIVEQG